MKPGQFVTPDGTVLGVPFEERQKRAYWQQIDDVMAGNANVHAKIVIGDTLDLLKQFGAKDIQMTMDNIDVRKIAYPDGYMGGKHNIGFYGLKQLPDQLKNPVAILKSSTQPNSLVIFTEFLDAKNRPVMVAMHLNKDGRIGFSNDIASMYGRKDFEQFIQIQE